MARTSGSHRDITGPAIRKAAAGLIASKGYAAVSMREIARAVGVQAGALYNYYPDKQSILLDLMQGHMEAALAGWEAAVPQSATPTEQLEAFVRFHIRFHVNRPEDLFIAYMELRNLTPENFVVIEALRNRYEGIIEEILKQGETEGLFQIPDSKVAAMAMIAMLTGVSNWYREGGRLSREEVEDVYWEMTRRTVSA